MENYSMENGECYNGELKMENGEFKKGVPGKSKDFFGYRERMENGELKTNIIKNKTFEFSLKIIKVYKYLNEKKEFVLSKQLLRSGTSIGANVVEALDGISKKDFRNKMSIALKEARETKYWLDLLIASDYLPQKKTEAVLSLLEEVTKILVRIVKNAN